MFRRTYKFLSLMMDHIFLTTSGRGIESTPIISESSGLSLTVLLARGLGVPSPFLAGGPRFLLVAFFQSSSESSGSELSTRFLRPGAPRPPRAPFFLPGDFFPGLYSSSLPPSYQSNFVNTILFFSRFLCSFFLLLFYLFLSSFCFVLFSSLREGTFKRLLPFYFNIFYSKQCYMISGKCVLRFFFFLILWISRDLRSFKEILRLLLAILLKLRLQLFYSSS